MPTLFWCPHQVLKATGAPDIRGVPTPHFSSTQRFSGGAHPLLFINLQDFRGVPSPHFYEILQIQMVQITKKPGTLFLLYTLSTQGGAHPRDNFSGTGSTALPKGIRL